MCVAIPGQVESIETSGASRMGRVHYATGDTRSVELAMVPDAEVGDHVIVHSGFAIRRVSPREADAALDLIENAPT